MSTKSKRLPEISVLNVLLCLLVIFIHITSAPVTSLAKISPAFLAIFIPHRLSSFVVPGFIFLSGLKLFLNFNGKRDYKTFYKSRLLKILIPYIIWVIAYYAYFICHNYFDFSVIDLLKYTLNGTLSSHFYFIIVIVQFYLLIPLFDKLIKSVNPMLMLISSLLIMVVLGQNLPQIISFFAPGFSFIYNDRVFTTYLFYWVLGCYAGSAYDQFKNMLKSNRIFITVLFVATAFSDVGFNYLCISGKFYLPGMENLHIFYCISAVIFTIMVSTFIFESRELKCKLIRKIDGASYYIYLSHCLFLTITNEYLYKFGMNRVLIACVIRGVVVYTVTIGLCILYTSVKKRLLGTRKKA